MRQNEGSSPQRKPKGSMGTAMDTDASKQLMVFFHWLLTVHASPRWCAAAWNRWPALLAYVRLYTMSQMALVCRSWRHALNSVMDRTPDVPSCLFRWQKETCKSPKLVGVGRMESVYMFRCINPASFERDCDIANSMLRWRSRGSRPVLPTKPFSMTFRADRVKHMSNIENFPCNLKKSMLGIGRTISDPCIRRTCMPLPRSASFSKIEDYLQHDDMEDT